MDPGTAIATGQVSAKVLSIIWKYYSEVKDAKSNITYLANEIQDFHDVMQRFGELLQKESIVAKAPASASLVTTIEQSLLDIKMLKSKLDPGTGAKVMKRVGKRALKWPFTKKEANEWVTRFQRLKATVNLALNADQTSLIIDVDANVIQLKQGQEDIELERQLGKLSLAAEASFDSYHRQHESQCIADTRVELLQQLQGWGAQHQRPIFWLSGMAGTGKSTIARTLAKEFKSQNTLGGSFFFSRGSGEANNAVNFVGTLAYHLANISPQLKQCIGEAVSLHSETIRQGLRNQWKELVIGPLSRVKLNRRPTLNFVIDALDECGSDDDIRLLLQLFVEVKDLNTIDLGVFVTSRPEIVIRLGFKSIPDIIHHNLDLRDIPRRTVEHDIWVLLKQELNRISIQHELHDWPSEANILSLVQKADCLFIYAATACRFVGAMDWDPVERLAEILEVNYAGGGDTAQLDEIYMQVLRYSLIKGRHEGEVAKLCDRFKHIVGSIVALFDELSVSALAKLLSMPVKTVDISLGTLHSVLNIPRDSDSPIRLLHPSFHDFLLNKTRCKDLRFFVQEALMHGKLVTSCFEAISAGLKRNICHLPTPGSSPQDIQRETLNKQLPKHVQYACQYWMDHLTGTGSDFRAELGLRDDGKIHDFFEKDFLHWLEVMSLMGKMSQGVLMITKLANMVEVIEHDALHAMVQDAKRFILSNRAIIEEAPLQTYASALVFSPTGSLIRKRYSDQLPAWLVRLPAAEDTWGNSVQNLEGHTSSITAIAISPDGKYLASASVDQTIRLWDPATGALRSTLEGHRNDVFAVAFSRDGRLASASRDKTVRLWEPVTGVTHRILDIGVASNYLNAPLLFLPNGDLAVECQDRSVQIWSRGKDSASKLVLPDFLENCRLRGSSPQGQLAFEICRKNSNVFEVLLYDRSTGTAQSLKTDSPAESYAVAFNSNNELALGFTHGTIELHDLASGSHRKFVGHLKGVTALSFSPDGKSLVSGLDDGTIHLWDLSTQAKSLVGTCSSMVESVLFPPDGKQIAGFCSKSCIVQLWNPSLMATTNLRKDNSPSVYSILTSPSGNQIASIHDSHTTIRLYDTVRGALEFTLAGHSGEVNHITFSPDGKKLASASHDGTIRLWDPRIGTRTQVLSSDLGVVPRLVFSSDGEQLASSGGKGEVRIWNPETGSLRHELEGPPWSVSAITFSLTGEKIAAIFWKGTAIIWDTMTGRFLYKLEDLMGSPGAIAFSHNDRYVACLSQDRTIIICNAETGESRNALEGHLDKAWALAFSSDSKSLASSSRDGAGKLWDVGSARLRGTFSINRDVKQLSFSADGTYLETERGQIGISELLEDSFNYPSTPGSHWSLFGREWIMEGNRKMLWLPPDFRPRNMCIAHHNGLFVIACESGKMALMSFTQDGVVTDVEG